MNEQVKIRKERRKERERERKRERNRERKREGEGERVHLDKRLTSNARTILFLGTLPFPSHFDVYVVILGIDVDFAVGNQVGARSDGVENVLSHPSATYHLLDP